MLNRDPKGKFIRPDEALRAWLPTILNQADTDELEQMLEIAAQWCCRNAQERLCRAAEQIWSESTWPNWSAKQSEAWLKRVAILLDCAAKIRETR